ncbi:saposin domain-containing protein, partial [Salmonella sp. s54836]|uniref:saposin domain-containing protein n=1 Tax=Salmonella sp. s54836 TaxID=3159673 RepID=UPI003981783F
KTLPAICSKYNEDDDEPISSAIECTACKIALDYLEAHNVTVKAKLESVCAELGKEMGDLYKEVCDTLADKGIEYLNNHTAGDICAEVKMCTRNVTTPVE